MRKKIDPALRDLIARSQRRATGCDIHHVANITLMAQMEKLSMKKRYKCRLVLLYYAGGMALADACSRAGYALG
jgi:hypothetical protein